MIDNLNQNLIIDRMLLNFELNLNASAKKYQEIPGPMSVSGTPLFALQ